MLAIDARCVVMTVCPRCDRTVETTAICCPHCNLTLKAHGHPGIPLHRATGDQPLCASCAYDADDSCNFPQRPDARTCTLYQDVNAPPPRPKVVQTLPWWRQKNWLRIALAVVIVMALLVVSL